ncbi:hypothetical protein HAX54_051701 [Datura stramonium]|uniref:Uncharacterized protein n=1 Tax=Datura stramonium TaxID=4076 RepID=A0ABS8SYX5_DATST|nr:hypothetical protein [Datura stramonium]
MGMSYIHTQMYNIQPHHGFTPNLKVLGEDLTKKIIAFENNFNVFWELDGDNPEMCRRSDLKAYSIPPANSYSKFPAYLSSSRYDFDLISCITLESLQDFNGSSYGMRAWACLVSPCLSTLLPDYVQLVRDRLDELLLMKDKQEKLETEVADIDNMDINEEIQ